MMPTSALISDEYRAMQAALHMLPDGYGGRGHKWADAAIWLCQRFGLGSVLDYGCGKGALKCALDSRSVQFDVREYDPAITGKDGRPSFADLVVCTDVLEHIEPDRLGNVLNHLQSLARKLILVSVALVPSRDLPDGRNAHLILKPAAWWDAKVEEHGLMVLDLPDLPTPYRLKPDKAAKQWIAVLHP